MVYVNNYNYEKIISSVSKTLKFSHIFIILTNEGRVNVHPLVKMCFLNVFFAILCQGSAAGIVTRPWVGRLKNSVLIPRRERK
jgi:hypothetical protein